MAKRNEGKQKDASSAAGSEEAVAPGEEQEDPEAEEEEAADLLALTALAQMDLEAAEAYQIGADCMPDAAVARTLLEFRGDHLRHVQDLEEIIVEIGGEALDRSYAEASVFASLANAAGALGPTAALLAMISNEKLTNSTYEAILRLDWDEDAREVLARNYSDEQRHLRWLEENRDRFLAEEQPIADA